MCEPSPSPGRITTGEVFTLHMHGYSQLHKLSERLYTKHLNAGRNPPLLQFSKLHRNHQIHWSPKPKPTRDPRSTAGGSQASQGFHVLQQKHKHKYQPKAQWPSVPTGPHRTTGLPGSTSLLCPIQPAGVCEPHPAPGGHNHNRQRDNPHYKGSSALITHPISIRLHTECYRNLSLQQLSKLHRNHQTQRSPTQTLVIHSLRLALFRLD